MRFSSARFACLTLAFLAAPACNAIFGISQGVAESTAGGGGTGTASSSGHGGAAVSSTASTASTGGTSASTASGGGADAGSSSAGTGGGQACGDKGMATCAGSMLTVCDATGHTPGPVDCGAAALCDQVGQKCNDYGRLSVGSYRACAIDGQHAVHCWGNNDGSPIGGADLVLGDTHLMFPTAQVIAGVDAWQVSVADEHQCALQADGGVACWGVQAFGELGLPPDDISALNGNVGGLPHTAVEIGTASGCSCARLTDGSVWCWGQADYGCLGIPFAPSGNQSTPVQIPLGGEAAAQIRVGDGTDTPSCARLANGRVLCWGRRFAPTAVPDIQDAFDLAVGNGLVFIRGTTSGLTWTNSVLSAVDGGDGGKTWGPAPPTPYTAAGQVTAMAAGGSFCAITAAGAVEWVPLGNTGDPPQPPTSISLPVVGTVAEISAGYATVDSPFASTLQCARLAGSSLASSVYCWGDDSYGDLGGGGPEYVTSYADVTALTGSTVSTLFAGVTSTDVVLSDHTVKYWGSGYTFEGNGITRDMPSPPLGYLSASTVRVTAEDDFGYGYALQDGGAAPQLFAQGPVAPANQRLLSNASTSYVDARYGYTDVGLLSGGQIVLYTDNTDGNEYGIFGDGTMATTVGKATVVQSVTATAIAYFTEGDSYGHLCAITASGGVSCWGSNKRGESGVYALPQPYFVATPTPVALPGVTKPVVSVAAGFSFSCATDGLSGTGQVYCWGGNMYGQLGVGPATVYTDTVASAPAAVYGINNHGASVPAVGVAAGRDHACAWLQDGSVWCWGCNDYGQLGNGNRDDQNAPVQVTGLQGVKAVSASQRHGCALRTNGSVACWGSSYAGQVGTGMLGIEPATDTPEVVLNLP